MLGMMALTAMLIGAPVTVGAQAAGAPGGERRDAVTVFRATTQYLWIGCSLAQKASRLGGAADSLRNFCEPAKKSEAKAAFAKARALVAGKPTALSLLMDYYAAWTALFDGFAPDEGELKTTYDRRQADAKRRLDELWMRFALEAGYE
jgi:hypothetical protein